jgi:DNA-binding NtrC family response regulator
MTGAATRLLVVADDPSSTGFVTQGLPASDYDVRGVDDVASAERLVRSWYPAVVLLGLGAVDTVGISMLQRLRQTVPCAEVIVLLADATVAGTVEAMRSGAFGVVEKRARPHELATLIERAAQEASVHAHAPNSTLGTVHTLGALQSRCASMRHVFSIARSVAPTEANVLVLGENGTGKELLARAIHESSPRNTEAFVPINCAAITADLLESELFGHRRGAFTGAQADRKGLLEAGHRGSVFLDEIGDMPLVLQPKLLRVLQDRRVRPVGSSTSVRTDFRLICATNVDVAEALQQGRLREDLYFRLNTITITLPPLRERHADIPLLARQFLATYAARYARNLQGFDPDVIEIFRRYRWPGNVRELQHSVERAVILAEQMRIVPADLPDEIRRPAPNGEEGAVPAGCTLEQIERLALIQTLEHTRWNKRATASILGIHRPTLYSKLRKYGLWRADARSARTSAS